MKTKRSLQHIAILCAAMSGSVLADNPAFVPGDLVLFIQQEGGADTLYVRLGNAGTDFRGTSSGPGAPNMVNFTNISTQLAAAFGPGWASDTSIYAGLAAVWGTSSLNSSLQDGDPSRTVYVSDSRSAVGTVGQANSTGYTLPNTTSSSTASSRIFSMNAVFDNNYTTAAAVSPISVSDIDNKNPFLAPGIQDVAFETFEGGIQQAGSAGSFGTFGAAGQVEFALDLYRILARNNVSGQVSGTPLVGSYEGTVTINASGDVSFISQGSGSSSPFTTWVDSFNPPLTNASDREEGADPDFDGISNLMEFVLNGNPALSSPSILPALNASGSNFVFTFTRRADSAGEVDQVFEYSTDLVDWTTNAPIAIPTMPGTAGPVTVGASTGTAPNQVQSVTITIPKGANTKLFGRLKAVN